MYERLHPFPLVVALAVTGCTLSGLYFLQTPQNNPLESPILPETMMSGEMPIEVDPRIELISVVQYLTGEDPIADPDQFPFPYEYKLNVEAWFSAHKDHPSVREYRKLLDRGFGFDAPPTAALTLDYTLSPLPLEEYPAGLLERLGGEKGLLMLVEFLQVFARDTDFAGFFDSQRSFYQELLLDYEHMVRAITTRMATLDSAEDGQAERDSHYYRGFIYLDEITAGLEEFEAARAADGTVTLADWMPEILGRLQAYMP